MTIVAGVDIETTGLLAPDGTPGDHRIIETYIGLWDLESRTKVDQQFFRIHPMRSIAPQAQAIHKISIEDLEGCPVWDAVAHETRAMLEKPDLIIWHNGEGFDRPFIDGELERVSLPKLSKPGFDTMLKGRWATPMGTVPNLGALCWACDIPYDAAKAHAAEYDVERMMEAFFKGLDWGWFNLEGASETAIAA